MSEADSVTAPETIGDQFDARLSAIATPERRLVLSALRNADAALSLTDLAAVVAAVTADSDDGADRIERAAAMLYHRDLPKLADAGLVEWDRSSKRATLGDDGAAYANALGFGGIGR